MLFEENGERIDDLRLIMQRVSFASSLFDTNVIEVRFFEQQPAGEWEVGSDLKAREFLAKLDTDRDVGGMVDCTSIYEVEQGEIAKQGVYLSPSMWIAKMMLGVNCPMRTHNPFQRNGAMAISNYGAEANYPSTVELPDTLLWYIELDLEGPDPMIEELLPFLTHKIPKLVVGSTNAITEIIRAFGAKTVSVKPIVPVLLIRATSSFSLG